MNWIGWPHIHDSSERTESAYDYPRPCAIIFFMDIVAHYDGRVFVPDEPVQLKAGTRVIVQQESAPAAKPSYLRKLQLHPERSRLESILNDSELDLENC